VVDDKEDCANQHQYLAQNKTKQLTFIHFTSHDSWCNPCLTNNDVIHKVAKQYHQDVNFIHVSFEPWTSIKHHAELAKKFVINGLPFNTMYQQGNIIANQGGVIQQEALEAFIEKNLNQ